MEVQAWNVFSHTGHGGTSSESTFAKVMKLQIMGAHFRQVILLHYQAD